MRSKRLEWDPPEVEPGLIPQWSPQQMAFNPAINRRTRVNRSFAGELGRYVTCAKRRPQTRSTDIKRSHRALPQQPNLCDSLFFGIRFSRL